uniref:Ig-like domain-containing protein n=1 Tax=Pygocentrus nattereri TaxID=42514 RepID=A0A3B4CIJ6_PYGNA
KVHYFCVLCRELSVLCVAGLLSVTGGSQTLLTLVAEPGDDVTIWSNHTLDEPAHIFWFRHTNVSVPHLLTCQQYKLYSSPASCSFIPQSSRMVMTANSDKTSLSITEVNYTDSGLYYCCIQRDIYITFSNATFLLVRASSSSDLFFMLTVVFSAVIVILLGALIIILKGRKQCRDGSEQGAEQVNYAALQFPSKTNRRSGGHSEEPQVLYSSVRH